LPADQLALHFQSDDEEEHRHKPVIDPQMEIFELGNRRPRQLAIEQLPILARKRRIGRQHRGCCDQDQQNAGSGIPDKQGADRGEKVIIRSGRGRICF